MRRGSDTDRDAFEDELVGSEGGVAMDAVRKERMNELWQEMVGWPQAERMSFALQLAHSVAIDIDSPLIDCGMYDPVAKARIYLVFAHGYTAGTVMELMSRGYGGAGRPVKVGDDPTPLSGDVPEKFVEAGK